jgi:hypothetical protein
MKVPSRRLPLKVSAAVEPKRYKRKRNAGFAQDLGVERENAPLDFLENNGG